MDSIHRAGAALMESHPELLEESSPAGDSGPSVGDRPLQGNHSTEAVDDDDDDDLPPRDMTPGRGDAEYYEAGDWLND